MTDQELQEFCNQDVELKHGQIVLIGKLVCGAEAQLAAQSAYAIETRIRNATLGTWDVMRSAIAAAEAVEWARPVAEPLSDARIED